MKRKLFVMSLAMLTVASAVLTGCKKGEEDPFLSLRSRDARVTGKWVLVSSDMTESQSQTVSGTTMSSTNTSTYDGTTMTESDGTNTNSYSYSLEIEIMKDGTYMMTEVEDGNTSESTGYWWWLYDKKNKTRIAFDDDWNSYNLRRLANKEMIWSVDTESTDTDSGGDISTQSTTGTWTFEKEK